MEELTQEEWENEMRDEFQKEMEAIEAKWQQAKEDLKGLIHPKYFVFAESHDTYFSEGIVEINETDEKQRGYSDSQRNCRIKDEEHSLLYMHNTGEVECFYGEESEYEGEPVEYWCWQRTGIMGDDYSGYLLLPMNDGRYWKISYSC